MKVLHINCNYIATTLHQLMVRELGKHGVDSEVFVPVYDRNKGVIEPDDCVTVCECFKKRDRVAFDYKQRKIIKAAERDYDFSDFDAIHAYTLFTDGNAARALSEKYGIPYVVAVRNTDVNAFFKKMVHLRSRGIKNMLLASRVFFLSESYRDIVLDRYVPEKYRNAILAKSAVIPNGIDEFWFRNAYVSRDYDEITCRIGKKKIKLVYAGSIDRNKNIALTCSAAEILKKEGWDVDFTVVGKVNDDNVFEDIRDKVNYLTKRPKEELIDCYRNADIFVMPSIFESFGLVYAEAMSQGLPVIYTRGQGFDNQFPEGEVGYHVSCSDAEDIAEKIKLITERYAEISKRATKGIEKFSWQKICERYVSVYEDVRI